MLVGSEGELGGEPEHTTAIFSRLISPAFKSPFPFCSFVLY